MTQPKFWAAAAFLCMTGPTRANVPFSLAADGHATVPAMVNGRGPFPFILDTGADGTDIYQWFAASLALPRAPGGAVLTGQTGTVTNAPLFSISSLSIDGHRTKNIEAIGLADRVDRGRQSGVAGNDFMAKTIVVFDNACGDVAIYAKPVEMDSLLTPGASPIEAGRVKEGTQLTLPVTIDGVGGTAVLDTGSRDTRINRQFARAAGLNPDSEAFHDGEPVYGATIAAANTRVGPIGTIIYADVIARNVIVKIVDLPVFTTFGLNDGNAMILGNDLMKNIRLVYDFSDRRMWFERSACAAG